MPRTLLAIGLLISGCLSGCATQTEPSAKQPSQPAVTIAQVGNIVSSARAGALLSPVFEVRDQSGPVAGTAVTFLVASGGGLIDKATGLTDGNGLISTEWRLGTTSRLQRLVASTGAGRNAVLDVHIIVGPPSRVVGFPVAGTGFRSNIADSTTGVIVLDDVGFPVAGVRVSFAILEGGGTLAGPYAVTDSNGTARIGGWRFGAAGPQRVFASADSLSLWDYGPPGLQRVQASAESLSTTLDALATEPPEHGFHIELRFLGAISKADSTEIERAKRRWNLILLSDLPDVTIAEKGPSNCPVQKGEVIDDIVVYIAVGEVDRERGILGETTTCFARADSKLPIVGRITLDTEAIRDGAHVVEAVARHELAHALGMSLVGPWKEMLVDGAFRGGGARQAYALAGGRYPAYCQPQTPSSLCELFPPAYSTHAHWDEERFQPELMVPRIGLGIPPLSAITVMAFRDMGYLVDQLYADPFTVPHLTPAPLAAEGMVGFERLQTTPIRFVKPMR